MKPVDVPGPESSGLHDDSVEEPVSRWTPASLRSVKYFMKVQDGEKEKKLKDVAFCWGAAGGALAFST